MICVSMIRGVGSQCTYLAKQIVGSENTASAIAHSAVRWICRSKISIFQGRFYCRLSFHSRLYISIMVLFLLSALYEIPGMEGSFRNCSMMVAILSVGPTAQMPIRLNVPLDT